jgi:hypothetical protein
MKARTQLGEVTIHFADAALGQLPNPLVFEGLTDSMQEAILSTLKEDGQRDQKGYRITVVGDPTGDTITLIPNMIPGNSEYDVAYKLANAKLHRRRAGMGIDELMEMLGGGTQMLGIGSMPFSPFSRRPGGFSNRGHQLGSNPLLQLVAKIKVDADGANARCDCGEPDCPVGKAIDEEKRRRGMIGGMSEEQIQKIAQMIVHNNDSLQLRWRRDLQEARGQIVKDLIKTWPVRLLTVAALGLSPIWVPVVLVGLIIGALAVCLLVGILAVVSIVTYPFRVLYYAFRPDKGVNRNVSVWRALLCAHSTGSRLGLWFQRTRVGSYLHAFVRYSFPIGTIMGSPAYYGMLHRGKVNAFFGWIASPFRRAGGFIRSKIPARK